MSGIYWRNGTAWARARIKGVEHRESLETRSAREAQDRFQQWIAKKRDESATWQSKKGATFREAVDLFTDHHLPSLKPASQKRYLVSLINLTDALETKDLQSIGSADLATFVATRRKAGVTDSTIRRDLACLSSVFTIAADYELCAANPVLTYLRTQKRRKRLVEAPPRERYLSHDEEWQILNQAYLDLAEKRAAQSRRVTTKLMLLAAIAIAIDTGLRDEELLRLPWQDVDLDHNQLTVTAARAKNKRQRIVPLLPRTQRLLLELPRHPRTPTVLWHHDGAEFHDLNHTLQRIAAKRGITELRWHDLRRTCGCRLLQDHKMPIEQVSQWLGHSSVTQTQRAYAFLKVDNLHESVGTRRIYDHELRDKLLMITTGADQTSTNAGTPADAETGNANKIKD